MLDTAKMLSGVLAWW